MEADSSVDSAVECPPALFFRCANDDCVSLDILRICDGINQCVDGTDERNCHRNRMLNSGDQPYSDPTMTIVIPAILAIIVLVFAMLFGIQKCKQWEVNQRSQMRRTRRIIERLTARLRDNNLKMIMKAQSLRNQAFASMAIPRSNGPPPHYGAEPFLLNGNSPPPSYEDIILDNFYNQHVKRSRGSRSSGFSSSRESSRYDI